MKSSRSILRSICLSVGTPSKPQSLDFFLQHRRFSARVSDVPCSVVTHVYSALSSGLMDYARGWAWQQTILSRRLELRRNSLGVPEDNDSVLLFQHAPVYTLGRGADESHLLCLNNSEEKRERLARSNRNPGSARLAVDRRMDNDLLHRPAHEAVDILADGSIPVIAPNGAPIYRVERGGEVTFHGPGQLVVYPLFDLKRPPFKQDLHWYLRMVEQVIIQTLENFDIEASRDETNTGVWVDDYKVAAVGVTSSRWITTHGFALNVNPDLSYFDTSNILPCGIEGKGVTSIDLILRERGESAVPSLEEVASVTMTNMEHVFGIRLRDAEPLS